MAARRPLARWLPPSHGGRVAPYSSASRLRCDLPSPPTERVLAPCMSAGMSPSSPRAPCTSTTLTGLTSHGQQITHAAAGGQGGGRAVQGTCLGCCRRHEAYGAARASAAQRRGGSGGVAHQGQTHGKRRGCSTGWSRARSTFPTPHAPKPPARAAAHRHSLAVACRRPSAAPAARGSRQALGSREACLRAAGCWAVGIRPAGQTAGWRAVAGNRLVHRQTAGWREVDSLPAHRRKAGWQEADRQPAHRQTTGCWEVGRQPAHRQTAGCSSAAAGRWRRAGRPGPAGAAPQRAPEWPAKGDGGGSRDQ